MSSYEQRDNSGTLFKNERKEEGSNHPDYNGTCTVNGRMMDMSAWLKTGKSGKKFMSFQFKPPYVKGEKPQAKEDVFEDMENDVPF